MIGGIIRSFNFIYKGYNKFVFYKNPDGLILYFHNKNLYSRKCEDVLYSTTLVYKDKKGVYSFYCEFKDVDSVLDLLNLFKEFKVYEVINDLRKEKIKKINKNDK